MEAINKTNPWWFIDNWEEEDPDLKTWKQQRIRWLPSWIDNISLEPFSLNFVYGPRQVGKTTGLKLLIRKMINILRVSRESVFYIDLDPIVSLTEFRRIMEYVVRGKGRKSNATAFIVLDEVTSVEGWWKVVKFLIDAGYLRQDVIVVSGSSSLGIIKAPERFPGRTGKGKIITALPLDFNEFVRTKGTEPHEAIYKYDKAINLWEEYKEKGGFPKSINEHSDAKDSLVRGLLSETYKHGKSPKIVQDVISSVLGKIPSAFSYNSVAQDLGISHNTVREYLEFLADLLVVGIAYLKRDKVITKKEKKVFFRDPFLLKASSSWVSTNFLESALVEGIVQEHVYRKFGEVYYFKNSFEIDVIGKDLKIEVKAGKPHRRYPKGVSVLEESEIPRFLLGAGLPSSS